MSRIKLSTIPFFSPVEHSPASNIPLVDDAARMEVAENALLVLCRHNSKNLEIKLSSDQNPKDTKNFKMQEKAPVQAPDYG